MIRIVFILIVGLKVARSVTYDWGWDTVRRDISDHQSYAGKIIIMDPERLASNNGTVSKIRYFSSDRSGSYIFYVMTPTKNTGAGQYRYKIREKSVTYVTYLRQRGTYRVVSDVIKVQIGDAVGFEFLDKILFTYSMKASCVPGNDTYRVYDKTELNPVYEGDVITFYDNPTAECKRMSYVIEVNNDASSWGSWDSWSSWSSSPSESPPADNKISWLPLYICIPLVVVLCVIPITVLLGYRAANNKTRINPTERTATATTAGNRADATPGSSQHSLHVSLGPGIPKPVYTPRGQRLPAQRFAQQSSHLDPGVFYYRPNYPYVETPGYYSGPPPPYAPVDSTNQFPPSVPYEAVEVSQHNTNGTSPEPVQVHGPEPSPRVDPTPPTYQEGHAQADDCTIPHGPEPDHDAHPPDVDADLNPPSLM